MTLDRADYNNWREAMAAHDAIKMDNATLHGLGLAPLGDPRVIKRYIQQNILEYVGALHNGEFPRIYAIPIRNSAVPLLLPETGLSEATINSFVRAADQGLEQVYAVTEQVRGSMDRESSGNWSEFSPETVNGLAVTITSIMDAAIDSQARVPTDENIDLSITILNGIAGICDSVASMVGGIAQVVLIVVAWLCRIVGYILDAIRGYFRDSNEGYNAEWDGTERRRILFDKVRILVQCENEVLTNDKLHGAFERMGVDLGNRDAVWDEISKMLVALSDYPVVGDKRTNAMTICRALGGAAESYRMCIQIQGWLSYVGAGDNKANNVFNWLYDARRVTTIVDRHDYYLNHRNEITGSQDNFRYINSDEEKYGEDWSKNTDKNCKRSNMFTGSPEWFLHCGGLDVTDAKRFRRFTLSQLKDVYMWLATKLQVKGIPGTGFTTAVQTYSKYGGDWAASSKAGYGGWGPNQQMGVTAFNQMAASEGWTTDNAKDLEYLPPAFRVHVYQVRVGPFHCLAVKGLELSQVATPVRKNYTYTQARGELWGAICAVQASSSSAASSTATSSSAAKSAGTLIQGGVWGALRSNDPYLTEQLKLIGAASGFKGARGFGALPTGYTWALTKDQEEMIDSDGFKQALSASITQATASSSSSTGLILAGVGALGLIGYLVLRRK